VSASVSPAASPIPGELNLHSFLPATTAGMSEAPPGSLNAHGSGPQEDEDEEQPDKQHRQGQQDCQHEQQQQQQQQDHPLS